jgi:ubiquinone/menaquinone biosynthesis C-methylase UbiE
MTEKETHHVCPWWEAYLFDNPLRYLIQNPKKILGAYLKEGMTVVDIGCGMGFFSINLAKIVGKTGKVISVDIQTEMIEILEKRAKKAGVGNIVQTHLSLPDNIKLDEKVDFAIANWVVHETPDITEFFKQVKAILKPESLFLVVEPNHHISEDFVNEEIEFAQQAGFKFLGFKDAGRGSKGFLLQAV